MRWRADDANGPGSQTDVSTGQADRSGRQADALDGSNEAEMAGMSHGDVPGYRRHKTRSRSDGWRWEPRRRVEWDWRCP